MLKSLTPRQKQIAVALAGAAVLALIALLSSRRGAAPDEATTQDPNAGQPAPLGSTFADNGEAAAGLSTAITTGAPAGSSQPVTSRSTTSPTASALQAAAAKNRCARL